VASEAKAQTTGSVQRCKSHSSDKSKEGSGKENLKRGPSEDVAETPKALPKEEERSQQTAERKSASFDTQYEKSVPQESGALSNKSTVASAPQPGLLQN